MTQRFETSQWVPYPVELVFAFFANPANLPALMPAKVKARIEELRLKPPPPRPMAADPAHRFKSIAAGTGSEILLSFRPLGLLSPRVSWLAQIVEFTWNDHFVDEQMEGPFSQFVHRHSVSPAALEGVEGTEVTDSIEYALPGGILGGAASKFVGAVLENSFTFRRKRLPEVLAATVRQATRRS